MANMVYFVIILLVFAGCEAYEAKYELVNGIPYNKDAPAHDEYPYCPPDKIIDIDGTEITIPCFCSQGEDGFLPIFYCNDIPNTDYITAYFDRPFPTYLAARITVSNSDTLEIPANVFADKQPIRITWTNNFIKSVDPNAFALTKPELEILEIQYEPELNDFPFTSLNGFPRLRELWLNNNNLSIISDLAEMSVPSLQIINLDFNNMAVEFPKLRFLPELRIISAEASELIGVSNDLPFEELQKLEEINFRGNKNIGSIQTGSFVFDQQTSINNIDLSNCGLVSVEPGAFAGLLSNTNVSLKDNLLTSLPEEAFRVMLETMIGGSGKLDLSGNDIVCCCDVNWLISNAGLEAALIGGKCAGGALINQLPLDYLAPLCPQMSSSSSLYS
ncbi:hypothetical protein QYM36_010915 [Artemia franciscana]|uniref:Oplophorus-luciferin 2-monooxygenase non-catalytic subunit n=1 Tax=Artemia franciscana TaxID=6661 RepID=A0AA88HKK7_ARTSF|nr:hypothetical protein QYM36_010915 [Artemia franciscana]KAK2712040.1 hypothetical protein QYM36_010915 [Artemia franciscana]